MTFFKSTSLFLSFLLLFFSIPLQGKELRFGVLADGGVWNENTQSIQKSMKKRGVTRLILPGDNLYDEEDSYDSVWKPWKGFHFEIVAIGNHGKKYSKEVDYFDMPQEYYSKVVAPDVRFVVLNSDNKKHLKKQAQWFKKTLKQAQEEFIFVVFHHSPFTLTEEHSWQERREFHEKIRPLLKKYRSKLSGLFVGHDHIATIVELGGNFPLILSGATQEPSSGAPRVDYVSKQGIRVETKWLFDQGPYWAELEIIPQKKLSRVHFIEALTDKIKCTVDIGRDYSLHYSPSCNTNTH